MRYMFVALLGIIAISGCDMAPAFGTAPQAEQNKRRARADIAALDSALDQYNFDINTFPTTDMGLEALVVAPTDVNISQYRPGGYIKRLESDPWGNKYYYTLPNQRSDAPYDVFSAGPDGLPNTEDDIGNWEAKLRTRSSPDFDSFQEVTEPDDKRHTFLNKPNTVQEWIDSIQPMNSRCRDYLSKTAEAFDSGDEKGGARIYGEKLTQDPDCAIKPHALLFPAPEEARVLFLLDQKYTCTELSILNMLEAMSWVDILEQERQQLLSKIEYISAKKIEVDSLDQERMIVQSNLEMIKKYADISDSYFEVGGLQNCSIDANWIKPSFQDEP